MESSKSVVKNSFFIHALKMSTEELLGLRTLSSTMNEVIIKSIFRLQTLKLHESKYRRSFCDYIQTAKTLTVEGITLTEDTAIIFEEFRDKMLERLESIQLSICAPESVPEVCERIANVMCKFNYYMERESEVDTFFEALNKTAINEPQFYKTVTHLELIINEEVIHLDTTSGTGPSSEIEKFIGNFENLISLDSFPRDGINPYKHVNIDKLKELTISTPCTQKDADIASAFVSKSKCQSLRLYGIQGEPINYETMSCPETLKSLTLLHLSNVGILNLQNTIPSTLTCLHINDVNLSLEAMKTIISKIGEISELHELSLENCETEKQEMFIKLAKSLLDNQSNSLIKLDLSCNHIQPSTMLLVCDIISGMHILDEFSITNLRTIQEYTLEDIIKSANLLVKNEKKRKMTLKLSDYYFEFVIDCSKEEARDILNKELSSKIFLKTIKS